MAGKTGVTLVVVKNNLTAYVGKLKQVDQIVEKHARVIQVRWMAGVPVLTGTYRRSIHVIRVGPSSYIIAAGVFYAVYIEFGTRRMPARPAALPAFEAEVRPLVVEISNLLRAA